MGFHMKLIPVSMWLLSHDNIKRWKSLSSAQTHCDLFYIQIFSFYFISPQGTKNGTIKDSWTEHELGCLVKDFIIYMFICLFLNFKKVFPATNMTLEIYIFSRVYSKSFLFPSNHRVKHSSSSRSKKCIGGVPPTSFHLETLQFMWKAGCYIFGCMCLHNQGSV